MKESGTRKGNCLELLVVVLQTTTFFFFFSFLVTFKGSVEEQNLSRSHLLQACLKQQALHAVEQQVELN